MTSSTAGASRGSIWLFRSLAVGSSVAVAANLIPIMTSATVQNSLTLCENENDMIARVGANRVKGNARASSTRRDMLVKLNAVSILGNCVAKEEALGALATLTQHPDVPSQIAECEPLVEILTGDTCEQGCKQVWNALGIDQMDVEHRKEKIRSWASANKSSIDTTLSDGKQ